MAKYYRGRDNNGHTQETDGGQTHNNYWADSLADS